MKATRRLRMLASLVFMLAAMVAGPPCHAGAQDPVRPDATPLAAETSLEGWFATIWGDSRDGRSSTVYTLTDAKGQETVLQLDEAVAVRLGGVLQFNGKYVRVRGARATRSRAGAATGPVRRVVNVTSIALVPAPESQAPPAVVPQRAGAGPLAAVTGSRPWVTIMCKFSDIAAEPNDLAFFQGMYGDAQPGLNHYWKELSFDTADVAGSSTGTGWYTLSHPESHYNPTDTEKGTDLNLLADDCIAAANSSVDYSAYSGINMMFNSDFDNGWAWGGSRTMTLDGATRSWSTTWEPPWSYANVSVIAHEMGHGFGLPHSSYNRANVYDNAWDVMSADRYNCAAATDPTYGCMAQHTISYHKDLLGWIPAARKTTVADGTWATVTLEDLAAPAAANHQIAVVPIGGSSSHFYAVEARRFTGYDVKLPGEAVIIHDVDTTNGIPAVLVPGGLSSVNAGVRWNAGETFTDVANKIRVIVDSESDSASVVRILNGIEPPTSDAGGPYAEECAGATTAVQLDGSGSTDPEGSSLTYSWSTTCDGTFDDPAAPQPVLTVGGAVGCGFSCTASLTVTDAQGLSDSDSATVSISDTLPPAVVGVPGSQTVQCNAVPPPAVVTATDVCDASVVPGYAQTRVDGSCAGNYTLTRTWTAADDCGNSSSGSQTIVVQDTVGPAISCNTPATIIPPEAPIAFTATAADNCSGASVQITGYNCVGKNGHSRLSSCVVAIEGGKMTILDSGGVNDRISWTVRSVDGCGNATSTLCVVDVVNPGRKP